MSTHPHARHYSHEHSVVERLNEEWEAIEATPAHWMDQAIPIAMVYQSIRFDPDKVLLGLVAACQEGYELAGRIVVQALLGKLVLLARDHPAATVTSLVSALWIRISTYPVARRRTSVAANLALDTLKDALRENRDLGYLQPNRSDPYTASTVLEAARILGLASEQSLTIVESVYSQGMTSQEAAEIHHLTPTAVRRRCSDTVSKLRDHKAQLEEYVQWGQEFVAVG